MERAWTDEDLHEALRLIRKEPNDRWAFLMLRSIRDLNMDRKPTFMLEYYVAVRADDVEAALDAVDSSLDYSGDEDLKDRFARLRSAIGQESGAGRASPDSNTPASGKDSRPRKSRRKRT